MLASKSSLYEEIEGKNAQIQYFKNHFNISDCKPATGSLRERQMSLAVFFNDFMTMICDELEVKPFLAYGTLLGYVRHGGFIPWDDDIDLFASREDFYSIIEYFSERNLLYMKQFMPEENEKNIELYKKWAVTHQDDFFAVLDYDGEIHICKYNDKYEYVIIDIFILDTYKNDISFKELIDEKQRFENDIRGCKDIVEYIDYYFNLNSNLIDPNGNKISTGIVTPYSYDVMKNCKDFLPYEAIYPLQQAEFENAKCWIPNNARQFLEYRFGDYLSFPDDVGFSHHLGVWCD